MASFEVLDILSTTMNGDEPRLKVGDYTTGKGVGQDLFFFGADGFIGFPNGPDGAGAAGQALVMTQGNERVAIASADGRYNTKAGNLGPGDRAIVSACDAALVLLRAGNVIKLLSLDMQVTLDGIAGLVTIQKGNAKVVLSDTGVSATWGPAFGISAAANITGLGAGITFAAPAGSSSIALGAGVVAIVATGPSPVTVNGVPLTVP